MFFKPVSSRGMRVAFFPVVVLIALLIAGCGSRSHREQRAAKYPSEPIYSPFPRYGQVAAMDRIRLGRSPSGQGEGAEAFRITVRMDDGHLRSFDYEELGEVRLGARVRVEDNRIFLY